MSHFKTMLIIQKFLSFRMKIDSKMKQTNTQFDNDIWYKLQIIRKKIIDDILTAIESQTEEKVVENKTIEELNSKIENNDNKRFFKFFSLVKRLSIITNDKNNNKLKRKIINKTLKDNV